MKFPFKTDQRQTDRIPNEAYVRYSVGGNDEYRPAKMFNVSKHGHVPRTDLSATQTRGEPAH